MTIHIIEGGAVSCCGGVACKKASLWFDISRDASFGSLQQCDCGRLVAGSEKFLKLLPEQNAVALFHPWILCD